MHRDWLILAVLLGIGGVVVGSQALFCRSVPEEVVVTPSALLDLGVVDTAVPVLCEWTIRWPSQTSIELRDVQSSCSCLLPVVRRDVEGDMSIVRVGAKLSVAPGELVHARLVAVLGGAADHAIELEAVAEGRTPLLARVDPPTISLSVDSRDQPPPRFSVTAVGESLPDPTIREEVTAGSGVRLRSMGGWGITGRKRRQQEYRIEYEVVDDENSGMQGVRESCAVVVISVPDGRNTSAVVRFTRPQVELGAPRLLAYLGSLKVGDECVARWALPQRDVTALPPEQVGGPGALVISKAMDSDRPIWTISATVRVDRLGPFVTRWKIRLPGGTDTVADDRVLELMAAGVSSR